MSKKISFNLLAASIFILTPLANAFSQQFNTTDDSGQSPVGWKVLVNKCRLEDQKGSESSESADRYELDQVNFYKVNGFVVLTGTYGNKIYALNSKQNWFQGDFIPYQATSTLTFYSDQNYADFKQVVKSGAFLRASEYKCDIRQAVFPIYYKTAE